MIDSHVHLVHEDNDRWIDAVRARMRENGVRSAVLFGSQFEVSPEDSVTRAYVEQFPDTFIPFLVNSFDIADPAATDRCISELESGFWRGVGELMLDCTDDGEMTIAYADGTCRTITKPVPDEREDHPLFRRLFAYCGQKHLPVLVHCRDPEVLRRTLTKFSETTFIWAHVDHGYYCDVGMEFLAQYQNLVCEFGTEFRFNTRKVLTGEHEPWFADHIARWRRACQDFPSRVVWGQDLFRWVDVEPKAYADGIRVWREISRDLDAESRTAISHGNIARLTGTAESTDTGDA